MNETILPTTSLPDPAPSAPPKQKRGFGAMDRTKLLQLARKGGKAAHAKGTAHRFRKGTALAREAGRKGGLR